MSYMETAQLLGNLGEFLGAIAVVATLIYLGIQVRQNTRSSYATRQHTVQSEFSRMHEQVAGNAALAELVARCRNSSLDELSPVEDERAQSFTNQAINTYGSIEIAYRAGQFDRYVYDAYCRDFRRFFHMYPALAPRARAMLEFNEIEDWGIFKPLFDRSE